jgi:lambda family phage portal protein
MGLINAWKGFWTSGPENPTILPAPRRRMYQGATVSRLTSGWIADGTSADAEIKGSIKRLRQRARQLVRDNSYARQAVRSITSNVIGPTGIKLQSQVRMQRGKKLDPKINEAIETAWKEWGRYDSCHTAGRLCFVDIERLMVQSLVESGEVFIRIVRKPFGRSSIPLALEILESDQLDDDYTGPSTKGGNTWRMGVELNEWMRPVQYAFLTKHPGDTPFPTQVGLDRHMLIPAKDIIHIMLCERPQQTRGVSWLASAIQPLHHLAGFQEASVIRARAASSLMGFITSPEGELDQGGEVYDDERVSEFQPGVFKYLQPGESISVPDLDSPNGEFPDFLRAMLRSVAAGCGVSFESVSRDFSQTNYSSSRLSLLEDRSQYRMIQHYLIENFHSRVFNEWLDMATLSQALVLPSYDSEPERYKKPRWMPRGWGWIDPQKEVASAKEAVKAGFKTQSQIIAELGGDIEELLPARKNEVESAQQLGLVFDTDMSAYGGSTNIDGNVNKQTDDEKEA